MAVILWYPPPADISTAHHMVAMVTVVDMLPFQPETGR